MTGSLTVLTAFAAAALLGKIMMPLLMRMRLIPVNAGEDRSADNSGDNIRPGGGMIIMLAAVMTAAVWVVIRFFSAADTMGYPAGHSEYFDINTASSVFAVIGGFAGFFSDYLHASGKKGGIPKKDLIVSELILIAAFLWTYHICGGDEKIFIPFLGEHRGMQFDMGAAYYLPAAIIMLAVMRSFECAALTDGIMCSSSGAFFFGAAMLLLGGGNTELSIHSFALSGSCFGFLTLNFPPAKAGCGRAGAMFAGFSAAALIAVSGQFILLPVMMLPLLTEGASCMILRNRPRPLSRYIISKGIRIHYAAMLWFCASVITAAAGYAASELYHHSLL